MTGESASRLVAKAAEILEAGPLCDACLGGAFGKLGRGWTNEERGRALRSVLRLSGAAERRGSCWVCGGLFAEADAWAQRARDAVSGIDFGTYLFAVRPSMRWQEAEALLVERFGLEQAEPQKHAWNRTVGKAFEALVQHGTVHFDDPDVKLTIDPVAGTVDVAIASVFFYGRYRKLARGIPQTHWPCRACRGRGCPECQGTGKQYPESVEELVAGPFVRAAAATGALLHGAGREDIDARMLGSGRPFVLELVEPRVRTLDLRSLRDEVRRDGAGKVDVSEMSTCGRDLVSLVKETPATKIYRARVEFGSPVDAGAFARALASLVGLIEQRTPRRVAHRRADLVRGRRLHEARGELRGDREAELELATDGGLYVKELVSGDEGRTRPSLSERLGVPAVVRELDVLDISAAAFPAAPWGAMDSRIDVP